MWINVRKTQWIDEMSVKPAIVGIIIFMSVKPAIVGIIIFMSVKPAIVGIIIFMSVKPAIVGIIILTSYQNRYKSENWQKHLKIVLKCQLVGTGIESLRLIQILQFKFLHLCPLFITAHVGVDFWYQYCNIYIPTIIY